MPWNQKNNIAPEHPQNNWNPQNNAWNPQLQGNWNPQQNFQQNQSNLWNPQQNQNDPNPSGGSWSNPQASSQWQSPQFNQGNLHPQQTFQQNVFNSNNPSSPAPPTYTAPQFKTPSINTPSTPSVPPPAAEPPSQPTITIEAPEIEEGMLVKVRGRAVGTFTTTQRIVSFIKRVVLTIVFLSGPVVAVVSLIFAVSAFLALIGTRSNLDAWLKNARENSITDVMLGTIQECKAANFEPWSQDTVLARWPGIEDRCDCTNAVISSEDSSIVEKKTYVGKICAQRGDEFVRSQCVTNQGAAAREISFIPVGASAEPRLICVKRDGPSVFDTIFPNREHQCPEGMQICGSPATNLTDSAVCEKSCSMVRNIHLDTARSFIAGNASYPSASIVEFTIAEHEFCTTRGSGTPGRAYPEYLKTSDGIGTGSPCSIGNRDNSFVEFGAVGETDLFIANEIPLAVSRASNSYVWKLGFRRRNPWMCSPFNAEANGKDVVEISSLGPNFVGIDALFWCQLALFIISLGLSLIVSIAIPVLLIWNGHLKKLWCGHAVIREGDRDDMERYSLCALFIKFVVQAIQFVPILIVIGIAYRYKNFWSAVAEHECSTDQFNNSIKYFSGRLDKAAGWMNIVMLCLSVLGFSVTILSCCCCWKNVCFNVLQGRPPFKRRFAVVGDPDFEMYSEKQQEKAQKKHQKSKFKR